jgi:MoxR-like ATPase
MAKKGKELIYTGEFLAVPKTIPREVWNETEKKVVQEKEDLDPYLPDPELVDAVNLAIFLGRPLLLMGEPGCGKTRLAEAVAAEFYHKEPDFRQFFHEWHIKSTTKAKEGIYEYDAIRRLGEAQISDEKKGTEALDIKHFVDYGPLAEAYSHTDTEKRPILLIDEIDKADLDFPNDLLREIDKGIFYIPELKKTIRAKLKPVVIITSNQENPCRMPFFVVVSIITSIL